MTLLAALPAFAEEPQWRYAGRNWHASEPAEEEAKPAAVVYLWNRWVAPEIRLRLMTVVRPAWPKPAGVEQVQFKP